MPSVDTLYIKYYIIFLSNILLILLCMENFISYLKLLHKQYKNLVVLALCTFRQSKN